MLFLFFSGNFAGFGATAIGSVNHKGELYD